MLDTTTLNEFKELSHTELATKLATIQQIVSTLYLDIINNEDGINFNEDAEIAVTKVCNNLYQALHNEDLF